MTRHGIASWFISGTIAVVASTGAAITIGRSIPGASSVVAPTSTTTPAVNALATPVTPVGTRTTSTSATPSTTTSTSPTTTRPPASPSTSTTVYHGDDNQGDGEGESEGYDR